MGLGRCGGESPFKNEFRQCRSPTARHQPNEDSPIDDNYSFLVTPESVTQLGRMKSGCTWREHYAVDMETAGSNPVAPALNIERLDALSYLSRLSFVSSI